MFLQPWQLPSCRWCRGSSGRLGLFSPMSQPLKKPCRATWMSYFSMKTSAVKSLCWLQVNDLR